MNKPTIDQPEPASTVSRRSFLSRAGLAGAATTALATTGLLGGASSANAARDGNRDVAILNFALQLEYLEAEFYLRAFKGTGLEAEPIPAGDTSLIEGSGGPAGAVTVKANPQVQFTSATVANYAREIAEDEKNHVIALRATIRGLGGVPASRPPIDLLNSFNTLAQSTTPPLGQTFDPFANDLNFLLGAFIFEDVGVTAYKGASPLIANKNVLESAAGILAVEASHSAVIRTSLFARIPDMTTDIASIVQRISDLRDTLDNSGTVAGDPVDKDQSILDANGMANLVVTDNLGIAFSRTTRQVLNIVYGAVNAPSGLFFPSGARGQIVA